MDNLIKKSGFIAIAPENGIGNRLRALCSYKVLAKFLDVPFYVFWRKTAGFDETELDELIDLEDFDCRLINELQWREIRNNSTHIDKKISGVFEKDINTADTSVSKEDELLHDEYVTKFMTKQIKCLSVRTSNSFCVPFFGKSDSHISKYKFNFWLEYKKIIQSLVPSLLVYEKAKHTLSLFNKDTVGIHIRRGDATNKKNPNCYNYGVHPKFFDKEIARILGTSSDTKIFLATDSVECSSRLSKKYGDKIIIHDKQFVESEFNSEKGGQIDAMVELFLLSKTQTMYATSWSTFSEAASKWGDVDTKVISLSGGYSASFQNFKKHPGVSLLTCCMNRNDNLKTSLESWLEVDGVDEIIIVDWSSDTPVWSMLPDDTKGKTIKLVAAMDQPRWILSHAFNLGACFATKQNLLKIDADIILPKNFLINHPLKENEFYRGDWKLARNKNELHLNGQIYCKLQDFWKVNGYHEGITTYGYDDSDLYNRIEKMGATPLNFNYDSIEHIVTDDIKRSESQDLNDGHIQFIESQSEQLKFKLKKIQPPESGENLRLFYQTQRNRLWVEDNPWLTDAKRRNWKVTKIDDNVWVCNSVEKN